MRLFRIAIAIAVILLPALPALAAAEPTKLEVGQESFLALPGPAQRISLGDPSLANVTLIDERTVRVLGLGVGETSLSVWSRKGGLPETYALRISPPLSSVQNVVRTQAGMADAELSAVNGRVILDGQFEDAVSRDKALALASHVTGTDVFDLSEISVDQTIQVEVRFAAVDRSTLDALGLNFQYLTGNYAISTNAPGSLSGFDFASGSTGALDLFSGLPISSAFNLLLGSPDNGALAVISALERSNLAETLAEPVLVAQSGETADFIAGGEFPIPVAQGGNNNNSITIEYRKFGIRLSVTPVLLQDRRIHLKIEPEVSELDFANAVSFNGTRVPALRTRGASTSVQVREGQSIMLAGLVLSRVQNGYDNVPFLSDIPVIGRFFEREEEMREAQELVVLVTPRMVTSGQQPMGALGALSLKSAAATVEQAGPAQ